MHSFQDILIKKCIYYPSGSVVKNLLVNAGDTVRLEEMGTHSSIFAWKIPWT